MKILVTGGAGFIGSNFVRRTLAGRVPRARGRRGRRPRRADLLRATSRTWRRSPTPRATPSSRATSATAACSTSCSPPSTRSCTSRPSRTSTARCATRRSSSRPTCSARSSCSMRRCRNGLAALRARVDRRGLRLDRRGLVGRGPAARAELAVLGVEGGQRPARPQLLPHARAERVDHALLEQLRAVPLPREGHPAVRHQPDRRQARPAVRRGQQHPRLAARRRPHPRHRDGADRAAAPARSTTSAAAPS